MTRPTIDPVSGDPIPAVSDGSSSIVERVRELAVARRSCALLQQEIADKRKAFEAEHAALFASHAVAQQLVSEAETAVRAVAAAVYNVTREKAIAPGVTIKEYETLHYDADAAYQWAKHAGVAIIPESLDKKAFEKIAKASKTPIAGSYVIVEPRVTIATDLDAALAAVEAL